MFQAAEALEDSAESVEVSVGFAVILMRFAQVL